MTRLFSLPRLKIILPHVAVWLVYIFINNILLNLDGSLSKVFQRTLVTYALVALLFYVNAHFVVDRFFNRKQYVWFALATVLLLVAYAAARSLTFYWLFPLLHIDTNYKDISLMSRKFALDSAWIGLQYMLFSYGYWFGFHKIRLEREKRLIAEKLIETEKEKIRSELSFLQAQLNPHFLFNTFNFLYSEAIGCSPKLANAILLLTQMMRTVTEVGREEMIPLNKEIDYIRNYLQIQQYRFNNRLYVDLDIEGEDYLDYTYLPPLLFISVVENMFKYGDLHDSRYPASIQYIVGSNSLYFYASNRKKSDISLAQRTSMASSGLGLSNVRNQLALLFGDEQTFVIHDEEVNFSVEINLTNTAITVPHYHSSVNPMNV